MKSFIEALFLLLSLMSLAFCSYAAESKKLYGTPIGTPAGINYESGKVEYNIQWKAFDEDLDTYFATDQRSYTWVGLDLGTPYVITRVGWSPRNDGLGEKRVQLGIFEGANREDFLDAVPIYIIRQPGQIGSVSYGDVDCSRGFRYVRWVSTSDSRCNIAELEFYGVEGAGDDSHMFQLTNIPTVCINTVNAEIPYDKEHDIVSNIIIIDKNKINVDKSATVRERGNASRNFPKKPWRIKFDKKQSVLDAPAKAKKWTLINNYGDKTLLRNVIAFEIARRVGMDYVPYCRPVDVIMNGEYKGCYQLCDQVEVNANRVNIEEMTAEDVEGDALSGGYFFEIDAYAYDEPEQIQFSTSRGLPVTIKSPDDDVIVPVQKDYIRNYVQNFENLVYSNDATSQYPRYSDIFDIDSFLQFFIVNELAGNTDAFWSTYMHKDRNCDKIFTGPIWDIDLGFENDIRTYPISQTSRNNFLSFTYRASAAGNMRDIAQRIITSNPYNRERLSELWSLARDNNGLDRSLLDYIDEWASTIDDSQSLNFLRWPILKEFVHQNPVAAGSYYGEVARVKTYLDQRLTQLDDNSHMRYNPNFSIINDVEDMGAQIVKYYVVDNRIVSDADVEFSVCRYDGMHMFSGYGTTEPLLPGLYIVTAVGCHPAKVLIR